LDRHIDAWLAVSGHEFERMSVSPMEPSCVAVASAISNSHQSQLDRLIVSSVPRRIRGRRTSLALRKLARPPPTSLAA